ncbi:hypothetical protein KR009_007090, partial [Drosophila setifemur]
FKNNQLFLIEGPGPASYTLPSTFGYANVDTRVQRSPQFSFGKRTRSCNNNNRRKMVGPGPADYSPGKFTRYGKITDNEFSIFSPH